MREELLEAPDLHQVISPEGVLVGSMPDIDQDTLLRIYHYMRFIRLLDERMMILQRQGRVGFYGACTGQEAPPVATAAALEPSDWIFPALREGAAMLYRGYPLEPYVCQIFGNAGDVLKGRQMPSHFADRTVNFVSWGSCIGTQLPHAVGAAWAAKLKGEPDVTVGFMGDGATSEGDFHQAMNFAGRYQVPCVMICQNNHWSISVPTAAQTRARTIAEKAVAYGLSYARVDGNDALAVYGAVKEAAANARSGKGPAFLELLTYRIGAHSSSDDPRVYRDEKEVEIWRARDPLERYRKFLLARALWSDAQEAAQKVELERQIQETVAVAEGKGQPDPSTLFSDVYVSPPWHLQEQAALHQELRDDQHSG